MTDPLRRPVSLAGRWSAEALEASIDREDAMRQARPVQPSTSRIPQRCAACREWSTADALGRCEKCRGPYQAAPLVGLATVR